MCLGLTFGQQRHHNESLRGKALDNLLKSYRNIIGKRIVSMYKPGDRIGHLGYPGLEHVEIRRKEATKIMEAAGLIVDTIPVTAEEQADKAKMSDKIRSYILAHPDVRHLNGFGSIDTCAIAVTVANLGKAAGAKPAEGKITVGGYDLMPEILNAIKAGNATWTVADYPYLQGYCTMLALWLNKQSHGVIKFDMNTGASFCDASNIDAYLAEKYCI